MGKRSDFERKPRDFYPTPTEAIFPLLKHLPPACRFCEPCAGNGVLADFLIRDAHTCVALWDIEPQRGDIEQGDATERQIGNIDLFITNPPWTRPLLHKLIVALSDQHPTWLLFDADWMHTRQAWDYLPRLRKVVAIGRVKWIADSAHYGKDNCAWHLFTRPVSSPGQTNIEFHGVDGTSQDVSNFSLEDLL